ncbi:zinc-binding dehydrogenase [Embleya sp. NPDC001921]
MTVRALVVDPEAPAGVRVTEIPEPEPGPGQVLIDVRHVSVNHGDLRTDVRPAGTVLGFDAAGVVVRAAADGGGPAVGSRVVACTPGAWARRVAVDVDALAELPDSVASETAAALPVAGVTALRVLRESGPVAGRRVLITGASGGVGRMAVQLAARAGAYVIASVGAPERAAGLVDLGAAEIVTGLEGIDEPLDLVLDNVGGPQLVAAWGLLAPGGGIRSIGWASGEPAVFPPYSTFALGATRTLSSFGDASSPGADLATLVALVAAGELVVEVGLREPWERVARAFEALAGRRVAGKVVLDVGPSATD